MFKRFLVVACVCWYSQAIKASDDAAVAAGFHPIDPTNMPFINPHSSLPSFSDNTNKSEHKECRELATLSSPQIPPTYRPPDIHKQNQRLRKKLESAQHKIKAQDELIQCLRKENTAIQREHEALMKRKSLKLFKLVIKIHGLKETSFFQVTPLTPKRTHSAPASPYKEAINSHT